MSGSAIRPRFHYRRSGRSFPGRCQETGRRAKVTRKRMPCCGRYAVVCRSCATRHVGCVCARCGWETF